ncbi:MAG TPA: hypothetical protein VJ583_00385, partial [Nitrososphaeraceae archaeon]|nr:hypothetical protein [Nitrososphaeraceae archaeon]
MFTYNNVMVSIIHDYETIIFYTLSSLMLIGIFALVLILINAPYNDHHINIKNIMNLPDIWNLDY